MSEITYAVERTDHGRPVRIPVEDPIEGFHLIDNWAGVIAAKARVLRIEVTEIERPR